MSNIKVLYGWVSYEKHTQGVREVWTREDGSETVVNMVTISLPDSDFGHALYRRPGMEDQYGMVYHGILSSYVRNG